MESSTQWTQPIVTHGARAVGVCYFQLRDISHWESWSIICLTNALSMGILAPLSVGMESIMSDVHTLFALELFIVGLILLNIGSVWHLFEESPAECRNGGGLKVHNVCNHETWIFVAFTKGSVLGCAEIIN